MKYLCLVYFEGNPFEALSKGQREALDRSSFAYDEQLKEKGQLVAAEALQAPSKAVTLRVRNGEVSVTKGPFAETKEHLGGFILITAKDSEEALHIASQIPVAQFGSVEVRPIFEFQQ